MARTASRAQLDDTEVLARNRTLFPATEAHPDGSASKAQAAGEGASGGHDDDAETPSFGGEEKRGSQSLDEPGPDSIGQPGTRGRDKRRPSSRAAASAKSPPGTAPNSGGGGNNANCRYDSSLGLLTKKFVALVEGAPDGVLDLNKAAECLQVQKRRIYDITNVLEGIGLIEKKSKNNVQWKGFAPASSDELQAEFTSLQDIVTSLAEDSATLERHIHSLQEGVRGMTEHPVNKSRMYVTNDDIVRLQSIGRDTVFAVTAPHGTTLVVPDPDEGIEQSGQRRYRAVLTSKSEPIGVWLVSATHHSPGGAIPPRPDLPDLPSTVGRLEDAAPAAGKRDGGAVAAQHVPPRDLKLEEQQFGMPGPLANGLLPGLQSRIPVAAPGLQEVGSPSTFMKLQTPEMDPESWFSQETPQLGVADIFGDASL